MSLKIVQRVTYNLVAAVGVSWVNVIDGRIKRMAPSSARFRGSLFRIEDYLNIREVASPFLLNQNFLQFLRWHTLMWLRCPFLLLLVQLHVCIRHLQRLTTEE